MPINIAIDGPSASGKSTVSDDLCHLLNYKHLDTGAMYRCVALAVKRNKVNIGKDKELKKLLASISISFDDEKHVYLNGEDVSTKIRESDISMLASDVSTKKIVREKMVELQRQIASEKGYIMDGRDIGTVVLPDAELKIYLTASADARAKRRYLEYSERGQEVDLLTLKNEILERDYQDSHRKISPLRKAKDAIEIDSSDLTKNEVVDMIMKLVNEKTGV